MKDGERFDRYLGVHRLQAHVSRVASRKEAKGCVLSGSMPQVWCGADSVALGVL